MKGLIRPWLKAVPWASVVAINASLCQARKALHKPTSDGYDRTRVLWEQTQPRDLHLKELLCFGQQCHRLAPFCFYNGNTFVTIVKTVMEDALKRLPPERAFVLRSIAGHIVAGTATDLEEKQLDKMLSELES